MINSKLGLSDIEWSIKVFPEDIPIRGNCSAISEEVDRETEEWIIDQLERGNVWAWARVRVMGQFKWLTADSYLGACSYYDQKAFEEGGYFDDMKEEIRWELQKELDDILSLV